MKIKPLFNRVIIKPHKTEEKIGGLYIPDVARKNKNEAEVIFVPVKTQLAIGDTVIYEPNAGMEISVDGEQYLIINEEHIIAKYDNK